MRIPARPDPWPRRGTLDVAKTAFVIIDMQYDFCDRRGYVGRQFSSLNLLRRPIAVIRNTLDAVRRAGMPVIYTRQGYRPDLADVRPEERDDVKRGNFTIGAFGPLGKALIRQQPGWQIIEELKPESDDLIINKTANCAFYGTDFDAVLRTNRIESLVFTGNTIDVCVHSTLRSAVDRGYDCLLLEDACGAGSQSLHDAAVEMTVTENGVFGCVTEAEQFANALLSL